MIGSASELVKWSGRLLWRGIAQIVITVALIAAVSAGYFLLSHGHFPSPRIEAVIFACFAGLHALWRTNDIWKIAAPRFSKAWQDFQDNRILSPSERRIRAEKQIGEMRWQLTGIAAGLAIFFALTPILPPGIADPHFFGIAECCIGIEAAWVWRMYFRHRASPDEIDDSTANDEYPWYRNVLR